jgi:hypothetical protein
MNTATASSNSAAELLGLWKARLRFGPDIRGSLLIRKMGEGDWQAEIAGGATARNIYVPKYILPAVDP